VIMEIKPFKAYRYNDETVGDASTCIAPPYDVISHSEQKQLYEKSKYNIVRLIKGKKNKDDNNSKNQYTRAAEHLKSWIEEGILKQDSDETIYAYVQDYKIKNISFHRRGFIALVKLEYFGKNVKPHETTLDGPKIDRLNLLKATKAQLGLVFMLYHDEKEIADKAIERAQKNQPLINFTDQQNVRHRLYSLSSGQDVGNITNMMKDKSCIIADGHHRYETALEYYKETKDPSAKYQMAAFVNTFHKGLVILATHRLVKNLKYLRFHKLITYLREDFDVTKFEFDSENAKADAREKMLEKMKQEYENDKNAFGIYAADGSFYVAVLKNKNIMQSIASEKSPAWRTLDVSVLHKAILENLLNIDEQRLSGGEYIEYVKDTPDAVKKSITQVDAQKNQIAFLMNPPKIEQIEMVTSAGEKMPQKSTYFFPKVYSGFTINKI